MELRAQFPNKLGFLFEPHRYKCAWGGRGGAKSWGFARALLLKGREKPLRILCARETQKSIRESVHMLLSDQIVALGLQDFYKILTTQIVGSNGSEFAFAGIRQNVNNVKSFEGFDVVWVEEAQNVSRNSWNVLIPTIRKEGSEIWVSFNPDLATDETYQRFVTDPPVTAKVVKIGWQDNPWFGDVLKTEMEDLRRRSEDDYQHVYEGSCKQAVAGAIYKAELTLAEQENRLTDVAYNPEQPVHTFWDLGFGDNTSIWFAQSMPFAFHIIDHISASLQSLQYYLKKIQDRPYVYGHHWLPHDAKAHELGSGRTIEEQVKAILGTDRVRVAKRTSVEDGIASVRAIFSRCWFDKTRCADGIQSLRHYRYALDDKLGTFKREPLHDWASHDADAFRTLGTAIKEMERPEPAPREIVEYRYPGQDAQNWMG